MSAAIQWLYNNLRSISGDILFLISFVGLFIPVLISAFAALSMNVDIIRQTFAADVSDAGSIWHTVIAFLCWQAAHFFCSILFVANITDRIYSNLVLHFVRPIFIISAPIPAFGLMNTIISEEELLFASKTFFSNKILGISYYGLSIFIIALLVLAVIVASHFLIPKFIDLGHSDAPEERKKLSEFNNFAALFCLFSLVALYLSNTGPEQNFIDALPPMAVYFYGMTFWLFAISCFSSVLGEVLRLIRNSIDRRFPKNIIPNRLSLTVSTASIAVKSPYIVSVVLLMIVTFQFWTKDTLSLQREIAERDIQERAYNPSDIKTHLNRWFYDRFIETGDGVPENIPLVFVTSSGGGLRAAAWTSSVLAELTKDALFRKSLWSIGGVSGGAFGVSTFLATASREEEQSFENFPCRLKKQDGSEFATDLTLDECLTEFYSSNVLSPVLRSLFTQDSIPFKESSGRTHTLLEAWNYNWRKIMDDNSLFDSWEKLSFHEFGTPPVILFNATTVEQGRRFILSNVSLSPADFENHFTSENLGVKIRNLGTAAGVSALFPYVSNEYPLFARCKSVFSSGQEMSAFLKARCYKDGKPLENEIVQWGNAVDGGYFENYGARTTDNFLESTINAWKELNLPGNPIPIVVVINSSVESGQALKKPENIDNSAFLFPAKTLLNSYSAHGEIYLETLRKRTETFHTGGFHEVELCPRLIEDFAPTTWHLHPITIQFLTENAKFDCRPAKNSIQSVIRLVNSLSK